MLINESELKLKEMSKKNKWRMAHFRKLNAGRGWDVVYGGFYCVTYQANAVKITISPLKTTNATKFQRLLLNMN